MNDTDGKETDGGAAVATATVAHLFAAGATALRAASLAGDTVHRPALLFRAGSYPDKGVSVSQGDLDAIIARFQAGGSRIPVIQEHVESPLDPLGYVVGLYRKGDELWGLLTFSSGIHAHIEERGVQDLSVALIEEPDGSGYRLKETSIVFRARVPGAGFRPSEKLLAAFRAAGKVTPAMEGPLSRLLAAGNSGPEALVFSESDRSVVIEEAVRALIDALPVVQPRGAAVPAAAASAAQFSGDSGDVASEMTKTIAARLGLDPARVAAELAGSGAEREVSVWRH